MACNHWKIKQEILGWESNQEAKLIIADYVEQAIELEIRIAEQLKKSFEKQVENQSKFIV